MTLSLYDEIMADNPEWYFRFEEPTNPYIDSSTWNILCTVNGSVDRIPGMVYGSTLAARFQSGDSLTLGYTAGEISRDTHRPSVNAYSVETRFRTTSGGFIRMEENRGGDAGVCLHLAIGSTGFGGGSGQLSAYFNDTSFWMGIHTPATYNDGEVHHVIATWQGSPGTAVLASQIKIYVDGVLASTVSDSNTGGRTAPVHGHNAMRLFDTVSGSIDADEMAFFVTALSPERVLVHYNAGFFVPVLEPPEQEVRQFPVIRGTGWVGKGSTAVDDDEASDLAHDASQIHIADAGGFFPLGNVEAALQDLGTASDESVHLADDVGSHAASAVSFAPASGIAAADVQAALVEVAGDIAEHLTDLTAHGASLIPFTPVGTIGATNVQDAIIELAAEAGAGGPSTSGLIPVMATSPNIVTTDGSTVWVFLVTLDGNPVMIEVTPTTVITWWWGDWSETWYSPLVA